MAKKKAGFRVERDTLGTRPVPAAALYGAQTARAAENFRVSSIPPKPVFIAATAMVKKAACLANLSLGLLPVKKGRAIVRAADEVVSGLHDKEFIVDVYQAGAGTSHNMNANEVIANRAIELLGGKRGDYSVVHPNDHVNMAQSTNDVFPTAMRVAALLSAPALLGSLKGLKRELDRKARAFNGIIKSGRTHLQDAVPVRLGGEFASYASAVDSSIRRVEAALEDVKRIGLGGTAVGTGLNAHPDYARRALKELGRVSGLKGLKRAPNGHEAINSLADFTALSSALRNTALELIRISNDLRLLSSGPHTGLAELKLPAVQPGSSIMPGKVNPVMAEMLAMACFQVVGNDIAVAMAAQAGQLELNVMTPVINYNVLQSIEILSNAVAAFTARCVIGIEADAKRCARYFERSAGLATILNRTIGYEKAAEVAKEAAVTGRSVREVVLGRKIMTAAEWKRLMRAERVTGPSALGMKRR